MENNNKAMIYTQNKMISSQREPLKWLLYIT